MPAAHRVLPPLPPPRPLDSKQPSQQQQGDSEQKELTIDARRSFFAFFSSGLYLSSREKMLVAARVCGSGQSM